jgi:hypothetical protein
MIKFFRKIRQKLLTENPPSKATERAGKFSKPSSPVGRYLIYALGEILLVVIGILIALQINNWNEDRKKGNLERVLLNETYLSITQDSIGLLLEKELLNRLQKSVSIIRDAIIKDLPYQVSLDSAFARLSSWRIIEPDYAIYDRLNEVGMEIIRKDSIKIALKKYYKGSKDLVKQSDDDIGKKMIREEIYPKYFKAYRWGSYAVPVDFETLKSANDFLIALDYCGTAANYYSHMSNQKQERARQLLRLIKKELVND